MTEVAARDYTKADFAEFVAYIRSVQHEAPRRVIDAYHRRAWIAGGYDSWESMCDGEGLNLPRDMTAALRSGGLSLRAIAAVTGVSHMQAGRDLRASGVTFDQGNVTPGVSVRGLDDRVYHPSRPATDPLPVDVAEQIDRRIEQKRASIPYVGPAPIMPPKREPVMLTLRTHTGEGVPYPKPQGKPTFNETTGDGISWAAWSWNPVTGCLHGCNYCYARAIIHRYPDANPAGFTPLFHDERLDAPVNTTIPERHRDDPAYRRVFVCSMADLYGRWVPDEWISRVHASMLATPHWQYILLTKFPTRYVGLDIPPNAWVGTSVDEQKRVRIAEDAFRKIDGQGIKKWLSLEPLKEPLEFTDLSMFDWVVIGAQTATNQPDGPVAGFDPEPEWVVRITALAKKSGCDVHWKPNLKKSLWFDEYPEDN
jgi:protein gp37